MKDHSYYCKKALEAAKESTGFNNRNKTGAIIVVGRKIIAKGSNSEKTHPLAQTFCNHPEAIYLHAEHDAIIKASRKLGKRNWNKARIYVARATRQGGVGIAKPCNGCAAAIKHFKIRIVCYTLGFGEHMSYATADTKKGTLFVTSEIKS